jgi:hypothetical protein
MSAVAVFLSWATRGSSCGIGGGISAGLPPACASAVAAIAAARANVMNLECLIVAITLAASLFRG